MILNVEEKERVIKLSALVWGLYTLVLVEQGFKPVKGIAMSNQLSQEPRSRRSEALVKCKIRKRLPNHSGEGQSW
jgi:hypothetical protein